MIHSCRLQTGTTTTTTGARDEYGGGGVEVIPSYETAPCLFSNEKGGTVRLESGELVQSLPTVILQPSISVVEGQVLEGLTLGYRASYVVRKVYAIRTRILDHFRCDLEVKRS